MRIYLDTCCLNRPWDDQSGMRVHLESEAVLYIVAAARKGELDLVTSDYLLAEIIRQPDAARIESVIAITEVAAFHVTHGSLIEQRALAFSAIGIKGYDALHLAAAEAAGCDVLLTTDDKFSHRCLRAGAAISIKVLNPLDFPPSFQS